MTRLSDPLHARVSFEAIDTLLLSARSQNGWTNAPVLDRQLRLLHEIASCEPTSMNDQPQRILFLRSPDEGQIGCCPRTGNVEKT